MITFSHSCVKKIGCAKNAVLAQLSLRGVGGKSESAMDGGVQYFVGAFCGFEFLATAFCTWQLYKQRSAFLQRICRFFFSLQDCRNRTIKENKINEGDMIFSLGSSELVDFSWFMTRGVGCGVRCILHVPPGKIWQG